MTSQQTVIEELQVLFKDTLKNQIPVEKLYTMKNRDVKSDTDRAWMRGKIRVLKRYNLAIAGYGKNGSIVAIKLTSQGVEAIGRTVAQKDNSSAIQTPNEMSNGHSTIIKDTTAVSKNSEPLPSQDESASSNSIHGIKTPANHENISLKDIMKAIPRIKSEYPQFEIDLIITSKKG